MTVKKPPLLCLVGPTASGKTEIAIALSKLIPLEAISCDSMQVYRSMRTVHQGPSPAERKKLKTHLIEFLKPTEEYSAAKFRKDTIPLIPKILKRKKIPLIIGGTGLYVRALLDGAL